MSTNSNFNRNNVDYDYSEQVFYAGINFFVYEDCNGYYRDVDTNELVHRVIARRFCCDEYELHDFDSLQVHHIDGDKKNNEPSNLEVLSYLEHCRRHNVRGFYDDFNEED
jgi:hypothetical protein